MPSDEERDEAYFRVGERVVDSCDILIALWDGNPANGRGGTAEIVELAKRRGRPVFVVSITNPKEISLVNGDKLTIRGHS